MAKQLEDFDVFSVSPEILLDLVKDTAVELGFPGLKQVASSTGVPMDELSRLYNRGTIERRYLPILYCHFFGNVPLDQARQFRVDHGL